MKDFGLKGSLLTGVAVAVLASGAFAQDFDVPKGDLKSALDAYRAQSGVPLIVVSDTLKGVST